MVCKICGKVFGGERSLAGHTSSHNRGESYREKRKTERSETRRIKSLEKVKSCSYCGKEFESGVSLGGHVNTCDGNPNSARTKESLSESLKGKSVNSETRNKISCSMVKAHLEDRAWNIGMNRKNSKPSYPEFFFMKVIENEFPDKNYEREFPMGRYSLDFAWVHKKKAIEIDGEQHERFEDYKNRDIRKDNFCENEGWEILRIKWIDLFNESKKYIGIAKEYIGS